MQAACNVFAAFHLRPGERSRTILVRLYRPTLSRFDKNGLAKSYPCGRDFKFPNRKSRNVAGMDARVPFISLCAHNFN